MSGIDGRRSDGLDIPASLTTDNINANDEFKLVSKYILPTAKPTGINQTIVSTAAVGSGGEVITTWQNAGEIGEEFTTIIWKQGGVPDGIVFSTWADVVVEINKVNGACNVFIDSSISPCVVSTPINGQGRLTFSAGFPTSMTINTDATITGLRAFDGPLFVQCANANAPHLVITPDAFLYLRNGANIITLGAAPVFSLSTARINVVLDNAIIINQTAPIFNVSGTATVNLWVVNSRELEAWTSSPLFTSTGALCSLRFLRDSTYPDNIVLGWSSPLFTDVLLSRGAAVLYDDTTAPALNTDNTQGALDVFKSRVNQAVNTTSTPAFSTVRATAFILSNDIEFSTTGGSARFGLTGGTTVATVRPGAFQVNEPLYIGDTINTNTYIMPENKTGAVDGDYPIYNAATSQLAFGKDETKLDNNGSGNLTITADAPEIKLVDDTSGAGLANGSIKWADSVGDPIGAIDAADGNLTLFHKGDPQIKLGDLGSSIIGTLTFSESITDFYVMPRSALGVANGASLRLNAITRQMEWFNDAGGSVTGPVSSIVDRVALWNNPVGTSIKNSDVAIEPLGRIKSYGGFQFPLQQHSYTIFRAKDLTTQTSDFPLNFLTVGSPVYTAPLPTNFFRSGDVLRFTLQGIITNSNNRTYNVNFSLFDRVYNVTSFPIPANSVQPMQFVYTITFGPNLSGLHQTREEWRTGDTDIFLIRSDRSELLDTTSAANPFAINGRFVVADPIAALVTREVLVEYLPATTFL